MCEEFNERFESVEAALKYIADSQAKSEFIRKHKKIEFAKQIERIVKLQKQTQKRLDCCTKVVRFLVEEDEFQEEKLQAAGEILSRKNPKKG